MTVHKTDDEEQLLVTEEDIPTSGTTSGYFEVQSAVNRPANMTSSRVGDRLEIRRKWMPPDVPRALRVEKHLHIPNNL